MPYIKQEDRKRFDEWLGGIPIPNTKGELEYCIFYLMKLHMEPLEANYTNLHDTVYAAQHCADEFRRRYLDLRENTALVLNGDVDVPE